MAKSKIDSEVLKKNSFWIGLGTFVLLWLIGVIVVLLSGDATVKAKYEESKKGVESAASGKVKTPAYQKPWNEFGDAFRKHKDKVWEQAWKQQAGMYTWPDNMAVVPQYPDDAWTSASDSDLNNRGKFRDQYPTQFVYIESAMHPVELAGGLVGIMAPQRWNANRAPTREEIWLAQEDYWVRREMLAIVREAVNSVAYFKDVTDEVTAKEKGNAKPAEKAADGDADKTDKDAEKKDKDADKAKDKAADKKDADKKDADKAKDAGVDKSKDKSADKDKAPQKDKAPDKDKGKEAAKPKGPQGEKPSAANGYRRIFRNANWEIDLRFEKPKDSKRWLLSSNCTIKNVNVTERMQPLANPKNNKGLGFRLYQGASNIILFVPGEPVAFGQTIPIKLERDGDVAPVNPEREYGLEQLLEWEMSPVRRIESLDVPYHSHRTIVGGLKIREDLKKLDPDPSEATDSNAPGGAGGAAGGMAGMGGGPPPMPGGMGGGPPPMPGGKLGGGPPPGGVGAGGSDKQGETAGDLTPINKINRLRYLHVKEQARHLPVAMKLVVDQSHVHDVLSAVANSRLRIQITQVSLHHVQNVQRNPEGGVKDDKGNKGGGFQMPQPGKGGPPPMMGSGLGGMGLPRGSGGGYGGPPPRGDGPRGPGKSGMGGGDNTPGQPDEGVPVVQDTAQLVELTVYGIASLYERFPPRKKPDAPAGGVQPTTKP